MAIAYQDLCGTSNGIYLTAVDAIGEYMETEINIGISARQPFVGRHFT